MLVGSVVAATHFTTGVVKFDQFSVFGLMIDSAYRRPIVLLVLWLALLYTGGWAIFYTCQDRRDWRADLLSRPPTDGHAGHPFFPEFGMFWGALPSEAVTEKYYFEHASRILRWDRIAHDDRVSYFRVMKNKDDKEVRNAGFESPTRTISHVKIGNSVYLVQAITFGLCLAAPVAGLVWEGIRWMR